jgi:hypothetical protein
MMAQVTKTFKKAVSILPFVATLLAIGLAPATTLAAESAPTDVASGDELQGRILGFDGKYTVYLVDKQGKDETVSLHRGTVINPTGIRLEKGFNVTIYGHPDGEAFAAEVINTPYHYVPQVVYEPLYPDFGFGPFYPGFGFGPFYPGFGFGFGRFGYGFP